MAQSQLYIDNILLLLFDTKSSPFSCSMRLLFRALFKEFTLCILNLWVYRRVCALGCSFGAMLCPVKGGWWVWRQGRAGAVLWEPLQGKHWQGGSQHPPPPHSVCFWSCHSRNDADFWCSSRFTSKTGKALRCCSGSWAKPGVDVRALLSCTAPFASHPHHELLPGPG